MGEEVNPEDIDFEAVADALERAGDEFSKTMLIELLTGALEALRGLSERVAVLEAKQYSPYTTGQPNINPYKAPAQPYTVWNTAQAVMSADAWCD